MNAAMVARGRAVASEVEDPTELLVYAITIDSLVWHFLFLTSPISFFKTFSTTSAVSQAYELRILEAEVGVVQCSGVQSRCGRHIHMFGSGGEYNGPN